MFQQPHAIEITGPKHAAPARRHRRLAASAGALITGTALALGGADVADAKTLPSLDREFDFIPTCDSGFTGHFSWKDGTTSDTVTVTFTPGPNYVGGAAELDLRGTAQVRDNNNRLRSQTVRLQEEYTALTGATITKVFSAPKDIEIWRAGVTATTAADPLTDAHVLDTEAGCE